MPAELRQVDAIERGEPAWQRSDAHLVGAVLVIAFIRSKEEQAIADQRPTDAQPAEIPRVIGFLECRGVGVLVFDLEGVQREEAFVLVADEGVPGPGIPTASRRSRDDRARRLLILGLEVLRDDAVLLDRIPRKWIPTAGVLSGDAAAREIVLQARAVNEQVDVVRPLRAG